MESVDWDKIREKLPIGKDQKSARKDLFSRIDGNGNGFLSLAELDKGIRDVQKSS